MPWIVVLPIVALVAAIYFNVKYNNEYNETLSSLTTGITLAKKNELDKALQSYSFDQLSESEDDVFYSTAASDNVNYKKKHQKESVKPKATWLL